jgi:hypothetical protein
MTVGKGTEWGTLVVPGADLRVARSDAEVRAIVLAGSAPPVLGLLGGDLMHTVGGRGDAARLAGDEPIPHLPVDVVRVIADGERETIAVAHVIARSPGRRGGWWRGPITAAMNAEFLGAWDVAPRSHPNDGRIDVVTVEAGFGVQQRRLARSRLPLGTHVPHPQIQIRQHREVSLDLGSTRAVWVDGERWGRARRLDLTVVPDAITVCV